MRSMGIEDRGSMNPSVDGPRSTSMGSNEAWWDSLETEALESRDGTYCKVEQVASNGSTVVQSLVRAISVSGQNTKPNLSNSGAHIQKWATNLYRFFPVVLQLHECTLQTESMIKGNQDFERHLKLLSAENEAIKTEHTQLKINQQSTDIKWKETNKRLEQTQYELDQTKRHVDELMAEFKRIKEEKLMSETEQIQPQKEQETEQQEDITVEADSCCKYICLRNLSHKDQHLGGWKVKVQINKEKPIMYKFKSSISLEAQGTVKLWVLGCCTSNSPTDLVWKDLKSWKPRDKLQINLDKSK